VFTASFQEILEISKSHHVTAVVDHSMLHLIGVKSYFPSIGKRFEEGTKFNKRNLLLHETLTLF